MRSQILDVRPLKNTYCVPRFTAALRRLSEVSSQDPSILEIFFPMSLFIIENKIKRYKKYIYVVSFSVIMNKFKVFQMQKDHRFNLDWLVNIRIGAELQEFWLHIFDSGHSVDRSRMWVSFPQLYTRYKRRNSLSNNSKNQSIEKLRYSIPCEEKR